MTVRGSDAKIGLYDETAYATVPGSPDGRLCHFTEFSLAPSRENVVSNTISADRNRARPGAGNWDVSGNINVEAAPESIGFWLRHLLGTPVTVGSASPFTHTFRPKALPVGFVAELDLTTGIASKVHQYLGCRITQATINIPQSGPVTMSNSVGGSKFAVITAPIDATLTDPGHTSWYASDATVKIADTASCIVKDVSISVNNNMQTDRYTLCGGGTRYDMPEGFVDVQGSITAIFAAGAQTLIENAVARTDTALEVVLKFGTGAGTAGNEELTIKLDHAQIALSAPAINSPGGLEMSFTFDAYKSGATDKGLVCTLKNAVAAAAL